MKPGNDFGRCRASPICMCEWVCESVSELVRRGLTCSLGDLEPPWCPRAWGRSNSTTERSVSRSHCW